MRGTKVFLDWTGGQVTDSTHTVPHEETTSPGAVLDCVYRRRALRFHSQQPDSSRADSLFQGETTL